jgi:Xaa-Pro dipeptidase
MSFGTLAVDYEQRVDFARLRRERLEKAKKALNDSGLGALVCFDPDNIRYITSATIGEWARDKMMRYCILPKNEDPILFDIGSRVIAQLKPSGAPWLHGRVKPAISWGRGSVPEEVGAVDKCVAQIKETLAEYGVEKEPIGFDLIDPIIMEALQGAAIKIRSGHIPLLHARLYKTQDEIELLEIAAMMADAAYFEIAKNIRPGIRENELVGLAHNILFEMGADRVECVNCISGPRTNPHHHDFTDRTIRPGDIVFLDLMNTFCGYHTCYYRTFCCGEPTQEQKELYKDCISWLRGSINEVKPGATTADIASRWPGPEVLGLKSETEVLANQFGHGIGLSLHEFPQISRAWSLDHPYPIEENMVFALETYSGPKGGKHGIRIEEEIVVTSEGHEIITKFPADELIACPI